jgi:hypothetical protein
VAVALRVNIEYNDEENKKMQYQDNNKQERYKSKSRCMLVHAAERGCDDHTHINFHTAPSRSMTSHIRNLAHDSGENNATTTRPCTLVVIESC